MKIETNEQLQECIEAIEDALERGWIEVRLTAPAWIGAQRVLVGLGEEYRLKPKPREFVLEPHEDGTKGVYRAYDLSAGFVDSSTYKDAAVRVREVIE